MAKKIILTITFALLLCGCGDSPGPATPAAKSAPATIEYNRGSDFLENEDFDTAIACFSAAIRLNPGYALAYKDRAAAYAEKGEYDKAIMDYSKAIQLNPDSFEAYNNRGNRYRNKNEYDKAIEDYTEAIRIKPDCVPSYRGRAKAKHAIGDISAYSDSRRAKELEAKKK